MMDKLSGQKYVHVSNFEMTKVTIEDDFYHL